MHAYGVPWRHDIQFGTRPKHMAPNRTMKIVWNPAHTPLNAFERRTQIITKTNRVITKTNRGVHNSLLRQPCRIFVGEPLVTVRIPSQPHIRLNAATTSSSNGAHGVVVSHPLSMREALGSIPSVSICLPAALWRPNGERELGPGIARETLQLRCMAVLMRLGGSMAKLQLSTARVF